MAAKLKNLKIRKVDFVDEGANPDAHIRLKKRKDGERQTAEEGSGKDSGNILKKMFSFIGKAAGMNQEEIDSAMDEIQKGDSVSFSERIGEAKNYKIADEMCDTCYALQYSLCSILNDKEQDSAGAQTAMQESLDEFYAAVKASIMEWACGRSAGIVKNSEKATEEDIAIMKSAVRRLQNEIKKATEDTGEEPEDDGKEADNKNLKGDEEEMKIDKSKMTDAERAFLESIEKRYGTEDGADGVKNTPKTSAAEPAAKSAARTGGTSDGQDNGEDGIYKGLHPAVKAELEALKKFRDAAEERELGRIAEKYAIIGKKKEDLIPMFKSLRATGGTAFEDMIAILDQAVDVVEKSGAFSEVGKSGHGSVTANEAEQKIDTIAKGYMEKDASLDYTSAVAKAWENNPELMSEYEEQAGF